MKKKKPLWRDTGEVILGAMLFWGISRGAVAEPRYIPSGSMLPTLEVNDRLVIEKISLRTRKIKRGDILVFRPIDAATENDFWSQSLRFLSIDRETPLIKRTVGLPGEVLSVSNGQVFINGKALKESYIQEPPLYNMAPIKIPDGHLFMMGDNRNNSADSHVWGPLPVDHVIGHAVLRFWPLGRAGSLSYASAPQTLPPLK